MKTPPSEVRQFYKKQKDLLKRLWDEGRVNATPANKVPVTSLSYTKRKQLINELGNYLDDKIGKQPKKQRAELIYTAINLYFAPSRKTIEIAKKNFNLTEAQLTEITQRINNDPIYILAGEFGVTREAVVCLFNSRRGAIAAVAVQATADEYYLKKDTVRQIINS